MMHRRTASGGPSLSIFSSGSKETTPNESSDTSGSYSHRGSGLNKIQAVDKRHRHFVHRGSLEDIGRLRKLVFGPKKASRRISCKELGRGDCQGWLWLKKSNAFVSKYVKRWCVFKHSTLYYYRNPEDDCAEGLILLHGFTITPAPEVKSGRYGFFVFNDWVRFLFASESELDRSKWMNVLGLAAIGLTSELQSSRIGGFHPGYVTAGSAPDHPAREPVDAVNGTAVPKPVLTPKSHSRPQSARSRTGGDSCVFSSDCSQTDDPSLTSPSGSQVNTSKDAPTELSNQPQSTSIPFTSHPTLHFPSTRQLPPAAHKLSPSPYRTRHANSIAPTGSGALNGVNLTSETAVTTSAAANPVAAICYSESEEETEPEAEDEEFDSPGAVSGSGVVLPHSSVRSASSSSVPSVDGSFRLRSSSPKDSGRASRVSARAGADLITRDSRSPRSSLARHPLPKLVVGAADSSNGPTPFRETPGLVVVMGHRLRAAQLICDRLETPSQRQRQQTTARIAEHSSPC